MRLWSLLLNGVLDSHHLHRRLCLVAQMQLTMHFPLLSIGLLKKRWERIAEELGTSSLDNR